MMSETLKYLYLLFSADSSISLDDFVFNTEGHPLKVQEIVVSEDFPQRLLENGEQKTESVTVSNTVLGSEVIMDAIISETEIDIAMGTGKLLMNRTDVFHNLNNPTTNKSNSFEITLIKSSAEVSKKFDIAAEEVDALNEMPNNETEVPIMSEKDKLKTMLDAPIPPMMSEGDLLKEMVKRGTSQSAQSVLDVKI